MRLRWILKFAPARDKSTTCQAILSEKEAQLQKLKEGVRTSQASTSNSVKL